MGLTFKGIPRQKIIDGFKPHILVGMEWGRGYVAQNTQIVLKVLLKLTWVVKKFILGTLKGSTHKGDLNSTSMRLQQTRHSLRRLPGKSFTEKWPKESLKIEALSVVEGFDNLGGGSQPPLGVAPALVICLNTN